MASSHRSCSPLAPGPAYSAPHLPPRGSRLHSDFDDEFPACLRGFTFRINAMRGSRYEREGVVPLVVDLSQLGEWGRVLQLFAGLCVLYVKPPTHVPTLFGGHRPHGVRLWSNPAWVTANADLLASAYSPPARGAEVVDLFAWDEVNSPPSSPPNDKSTTTSLRELLCARTPKNQHPMTLSDVKLGSDLGECFFVVARDAFAAAMGDAIRVHMNCVEQLLAGRERHSSKSVFAPVGLVGPSGLGK